MEQGKKILNVIIQKRYIAVRYFGIQLYLVIWVSLHPQESKGNGAVDSPQILLTVALILDHSYLVGKLTSSKIAETKLSGF
jgi:hypothetical protein